MKEQPDEELFSNNETADLYQVLKSILLLRCQSSQGWTFFCFYNFSDSRYMNNQNQKYVQWSNIDPKNMGIYPTYKATKYVSNLKIVLVARILKDYQNP